jgi:hypothetical protein
MASATSSMADSSSAATSSVLKVRLWSEMRADRNRSCRSRSLSAAFVIESAER